MTGPGMASDSQFVEPPVSFSDVAGLEEVLANYGVTKPNRTVLFRSASETFHRYRYLTAQTGS